MVRGNLPGWGQPDPKEVLVHVNVGGLKRSLCSSTLRNFPETRLGKLLSCDTEEAILQVPHFLGALLKSSSVLFSPNILSRLGIIKYYLIVSKDYLQTFQTPYVHLHLPTY